MKQILGASLQGRRINYKEKRFYNIGTSSICGCLFALFSGQPLVIIGKCGATTLSIMTFNIVTLSITIRNMRKKA